MYSILTWEVQAEVGYVSRRGSETFETWATRTGGLGPEDPPEVLVESTINGGRWIHTCPRCRSVWPTPSQGPAHCGMCGLPLTVSMDPAKAEVLEQFPSPRRDYAPLRTWLQGDTLESVQARVDKWIAQGSDPWGRHLSIGSIFAWTAGQILRDSDLRIYVNELFQDLAGRNGDVEFEDDLKPADGKTYILPNSASGPMTSLARNGNDQPIYFDTGGTARELFDASQLWIPGASNGDLMAVGSAQVPHKAAGDTRTLRRATRVSRPTEPGDHFLRGRNDGSLEWDKSVGPWVATDPFEVPLSGLSPTRPSFITSTNDFVNVISRCFGGSIALGLNDHGLRSLQRWTDRMNLLSISGASQSPNRTITLPWPGIYFAYWVGHKTTATDASLTVTIGGQDAIVESANYDNSSLTSTAISPDPSTLDLRYFFITGRLFYAPTKDAMATFGTSAPALVRGFGLITNLINVGDIPGVTW